MSFIRRDVFNIRPYLQDVKATYSIKKILMYIHAKTTFQKHQDSPISFLKRKKYNLNVHKEMYVIA